MVADPRRPDPVRTFLTPRVPGPIPTPEEVDFAFHLINKDNIPWKAEGPQSRYVADVLKKIRQKYAPGEARRQLRRDYESKLGRRAEHYFDELHGDSTSAYQDAIDAQYEDWELEQQGVPKNERDVIRRQKAEKANADHLKVVQKSLRYEPDPLLNGLASNPNDYRSKVAQEELLRRKAVRGLQLISRDDIPRRGLLKMGASQLPVVKQGQRLLEVGEKASPVLIKALKAILSRKFRSM